MDAMTSLNHTPRPTLVLAHTDDTYAELTVQFLQSLGWRVLRVRSAAEARRLARARRPAAVALDTELADESGWLTCCKLTGEYPLLKVLLISPGPTERLTRFAAFVGASGLLAQEDSSAALLQELEFATELIAS